MYHPWRRFRGLAAWTLQQTVLPSGVHGLTDWLTGTVSIELGLTQAERRCTLAHELVHIERGPVPRDPWLAAREESQVEREAARRLVGVYELGEALAWSWCPQEVADELWVDTATLRARLNTLTADERAYLNARLAFRDWH